MAIFFVILSCIFSGLTDNHINICEVGGWGGGGGGHFAGGVIKKVANKMCVCRGKGSEIAKFCRRLK